tara:strand:+ start:36 stop:2096 length:2061 start_codon:yes stop_codon:yes gene_type:complete
MGKFHPSRRSYATTISNTKTNLEQIGGNSKAGLSTSIGTTGPINNHIKIYGTPFSANNMIVAKQNDLVNEVYEINKNNQIKSVKYFMTRTPADGINLKTREQEQEYVNYWMAAQHLNRNIPIIRSLLPTHCNPHLGYCLDQQTIENVLSSPPTQNNVYLLSSSGGGIRAMYGAYSFIKAIYPLAPGGDVEDNLYKFINTFINIGVVSGSSWFFTQLYNNQSFKTDLITSSPETFVETWNNNYVNKIRDMNKGSNRVETLEEREWQNLASLQPCNLITEILTALLNLSQFINVPGAEWETFVSEVILSYTNDIFELDNNFNKNLLYGISFPFSIFNNNINTFLPDRTQTISECVMTKNLDYTPMKQDFVIPVYYDISDRLLGEKAEFKYADKRGLEFQLQAHDIRYGLCGVEWGQGLNIGKSFNISDIKADSIQQVTAACSAALGGIDGPGIIEGILDPEDSFFGNLFCDTLERCLPNTNTNLSVPFTLPITDPVLNSSKTPIKYRLLDGAYTDNSSLLITLSEYFNKTQVPPPRDTIINLISLNHGPLGKHGDNIDPSTFELAQFFSNTSQTDPTISGPYGGKMPNQWIFKEPFPLELEKWNTKTYIWYNVNTFTTRENPFYGIKGDYTVNLLSIFFQWPTLMIDFNPNLIYLNIEMNKEYKKLVKDTIQEIKSTISQLNFFKDII